MAGKVLTQKFFNKPALKVAEELLGKYLVRRYRGKNISAIITEVEAYDGPSDKGSHASRGMTTRNKIMFGSAGRWYIYFTYGIHWMVNIVTGKEGYPAAVLIRGVEGIHPVRNLARAVRAPKGPMGRAIYNGINGPARVTKFFHIDKKLNGKMADKRSELWIEDRGIRIKKSEIKKYPRVGIDYAGPIWSKKPYRFSIER